MSTSGLTPEPDALTLVIPLKAKEGLSLDDFYEYWLNAHVTLPPRFAGISDIWLHAVSFDSQTWPRTPGISHRPAPEDDFHGVPEATFPTMEDLGAFQGASRVQMEDGINFLSQQIAYCSFGANTATELDDTGVPAPDGHDAFSRHLLFLRRRDDVSIDDFRAWVVENLAPSLAASSDVIKVRRHLFEQLEVTLDHPGVEMSKPLDRQYQAMVEVVVADDASLERFADTSAWSSIADSISAHCNAVHAARVERCITTKFAGDITLAGVRGIAVADAIRRLEATSQLEADVSHLFLPKPTHVLV